MLQKLDVLEYRGRDAAARPDRGARQEQRRPRVAAGGIHALVGEVAGERAQRRRPEMRVRREGGQAALPAGRLRRRAAFGAGLVAAGGEGGGLLLGLGAGLALADGLAALVGDLEDGGELLGDLGVATGGGAYRLVHPIDDLEQVVEGHLGDVAEVLLLRLRDLPVGRRLLVALPQRLGRGHVGRHLAEAGAQRRGGIDDLVSGEVELGLLTLGDLAQAADGVLVERPIVGRRRPELRRLRERRAPRVGDGTRSASRSTGASTAPGDCLRSSVFLPMCPSISPAMKRRQGNDRNVRTASGVKRFCASAPMARRGIDIVQKQTDLSRAQIHLSRRQIDLSRRQMDLSRRQMDLSRRQVDLSRRQMDLSRRQVDLSRRQMDLSRRQIRPLSCRGADDGDPDDRQLDETNQEGSNFSGFHVAILSLLLLGLWPRQVNLSPGESRPPLRRCC